MIKFFRVFREVKFQRMIIAVQSMQVARFFAVLFFFLSVFYSGFSQKADDFNKKGENKIQMGKYDEAIIEFTQALKVDSLDLNALSKRAFCYSYNGKYEEAIRDYDKLLKLKPDHTFGYLSRGSAKNKLKKFNQAISDFDKVLSLEPNNTEALNNRGWAKKGLNDFEGACQDWKLSKKLGNKEAKIILNNNNCK